MTDSDDYYDEEGAEYDEYDQSPYEDGPFDGDELPGEQVEPEPVEAWTLVAALLATGMVLSWALVFARAGHLSIQFQARVVPTLGALTIPVLAWGLIVAVRNPPAFSKRRLVGFLVLLAVGYVGNVPLFPPPLATEDWTHPAEVRLPFDGEWVTLAGGADPDRNYHSTTAAHRWAYDFTVLQDGKKFRLDGKKKEDFFCWGRQVLAPVGGKVLHVEEMRTDNVPGEVAMGDVYGNHVVIEVAPDYYVWVAHLRQLSVEVEPGDVVEAGQFIAACGNSGRTVEPHVHIHAQDGLDFPIAQGLPLRFKGYQVNGAAQPDGMPTGSTDWNLADGDRVTHRP